MLPENEKKLRALIRASEATASPYEVIEYRGRKLLISRAKLKDAINLTWERVHDPETAELARDMRITLKKLRGFSVLQ